MSARRLLGIAAVLAVLVAAGCGGSSTGCTGGTSGVKEGGIFTRARPTTSTPLIRSTTSRHESVTAYEEVYPELVQYGPDLKDIVPSYAKSWDVSSDGKTWTYHLESGGKWSDGKPLTSEDVAWTANTIIKYQYGPTAVLASSISHVTSVDAPDPNTAVFHYDAPVGNALPLISGLFILPKHVWAQYDTNKGKDLKTFLPEQHLPLVSGGPFQITQYEKKGTTVFKPNPGWWGTKPHVEAVGAGLLHQRRLDDRRPAVGSRSRPSTRCRSPPSTPSRRRQRSRSTPIPSRRVSSISPGTRTRYKPQHRELLDPQGQAGAVDVRRPSTRSRRWSSRVRRPRRQACSARSASPGAARTSEAGQFNCTEGNAMLDQLGYKKGADGIRIAPATTGKYARACAPMEYQIMVPNSLDFNGNREFSIIQDGFAKAGVKVTLQAGGDAERRPRSSTATTAARPTAPVTTLRHRPVGLVLLHRSGLPAVGADQRPVVLLERPGLDNPAYNAMYKQEGISAGDARKTLVAKMDKLISDEYIYTFLVNEEAISASLPSWGGYHPELNGYNYGYMTEPYLK